MLFALQKKNKYIFIRTLILITFDSFFKKDRLLVDFFYIDDRM